MNPVRGIETTEVISFSFILCAFKLMNPVRGIETILFIQENSSAPYFQINESRSRDWNENNLAAQNILTSFQINESRSRDWNINIWVKFLSDRNFQINESRSRDWNNLFGLLGDRSSPGAFKLMNPVRGIETKRF